MDHWNGGDKVPTVVGFLSPLPERQFSRTGVPNQCLRAFLHWAQPYRSRTARAKPMNTGFPSRTGMLELRQEACVGSSLRKRKVGVRERISQELTEATESWEQRNTN